MEGREIKQLATVSLSVFGSLSYCYLVSSKIPKGKFRLLSLLPVIYLFTALPLCFSYLFPNAIATLFISWLGNFKLLLFAFDQGPLSAEPPNRMSLLQFISIASLPIEIKKNGNPALPRNPKTPRNSGSKGPKLPVNWETKVLIFATLVGVQAYKRHLHPNIVVVMYGCLAYLLIDILFGICNAMVRATLKIDLEPPSNEPYFATSLQDFWGKRWNLMVSNLLHQTIYKPVRSSLGTTLGKRAALPALLATFLVSGLMHELLFYRVTLMTPSWEVTCFFVLHGLCLVVELGLKQLFAGGWQPHPAVTGPLTVGFVLVTARWLFFPPLLRAGADERAIGECKMLLNFVRGA